MVRFSFPSKPGVCGDGENIRITRDGGTSGRSDLRECVEGPVRLEITRRDGRLADADVRVGGHPRGVDVELGGVTAAAAVEYLLSDDALRNACANAAQHMVFASTLANAESWPALLRLARNRDHTARTRKSAIFWLGNIAGERATGGLRSIAGNESEDVEVRKQVVGDILKAGAALGGAVGGEHGIGTEKKRYLAEIEDPAKLDLMRRIKTSFDPAGILNPGVIFD